MREQIRRMIDQAKRPGDELGIDGSTDPALRLASEAIRLARLSASTHMVLAARMTAAPPGTPLDTLTAQGSST